MTFQDLKKQLSDPIVAGGLLLVVLGEVQAQSDLLLSWLGQEGAGRVLSLIGIIGVVIRKLQALAASKGEDDDSQDSGV